MGLKSGTPLSTINDKHFKPGKIDQKKFCNVFLILCKKNKILFRLKHFCKHSATEALITCFPFGENKISHLQWRSQKCLVDQIDFASSPKIL